MDNYSISHTRWNCQYHIVFIPKYRKKVMYGKVREDMREILRTLCQYKKVEIIEGALCIHFLFSPVDKYFSQVEIRSSSSLQPDIRKKRSSDGCCESDF